MSNALLGAALVIPSSVIGRHIQDTFGFSAHWATIAATLAQLPFVGKFVYGYVIDSMPLGGFAVRGHATAASLAAWITGLVMMVLVYGEANYKASVSVLDFAAIVALQYVFLAFCSSIIDRGVMHETERDNEALTKEGGKDAFLTSQGHTRSTIPTIAWMSRDAGALCGFMIASAWEFKTDAALFVVQWAVLGLFAIALYTYTVSDTPVLDLPVHRSHLVTHEIVYRYINNPETGIVMAGIVYCALALAPSPVTVIDFMATVVDRGVEFHVSVARASRGIEYAGQIVGMVMYLGVVIPSAGTKREHARRGDVVSHRWPRPVHTEFLVCLLLKIASTAMLMVSAATASSDNQAISIGVGAASLFAHGVASRLVVMPLYDYFLQVVAHPDVRNTAYGSIVSIVNACTFMSVIIGDTVAAALDVRATPSRGIVFFIVIFAFELFLGFLGVVTLTCERSRTRVVTHIIHDSHDEHEIETGGGDDDSRELMGEAKANEQPFSIDADDALR